MRREQLLNIEYQLEKVGNDIDRLTNKLYRLEEVGNDPEKITKVRNRLNEQLARLEGMVQVLGILDYAVGWSDQPGTEYDKPNIIKVER